MYVLVDDPQSMDKADCYGELFRQTEPVCEALKVVAKQVVSETLGASEAWRDQEDDLERGAPLVGISLAFHCPAALEDVKFERVHVFQTRNEGSDVLDNSAFVGIRVTFDGVNDTLR